MMGQGAPLSRQTNQCPELCGLHTREHARISHVLTATLPLRALAPHAARSQDRIVNSRVPGVRRAPAARHDDRRLSLQLRTLLDLQFIVSNLQMINAKQFIMVCIH